MLDGWAATPYGITADPKPQDIDAVGRLERIEFRGDEENATLYIVTARLHRRPRRRHGWFIINLLLAGKMWVGAELSIDEGESPVFHAKCYLGQKIDNQPYNLFVVLSEQPEALRDGQEIPRSFNWTAEGFLKSDAQNKTNDGTSGFTAERKPETPTPKSAKPEDAKPDGLKSKSPRSSR